MIEAMYRHLDDWLVDQDSEIRASQVQGLLGGLMATNINIKREEFVAHLMEYADLQSMQLAEISEQLETLFITLHESWVGIAVDFELLLPDDDELIDERVDALGTWCEAFLAGFGLSGQLTQDSKLSDDVRSALADLSEIARIEVGEEDGMLEKEFSDVSEHVRLSAVLVATELCDLPKFEVQTPFIH